MERWPDLEIGRRYVVNVAYGGVVSKARGELVELQEGWAKILHEESRRWHPCWVPLERVLTITELDSTVDARAARDGRRETVAAPKDRRGWMHPTIDELAVSVLGA